MNNLEFAKSFEKLPAACMRFTKNEDNTYLVESVNCYLKLDEETYDYIIYEDSSLSKLKNVYKSDFFTLRQNATVEEIAEEYLGNIHADCLSDLSYFVVAENEEEYEIELFVEPNADCYRAVLMENKDYFKIAFKILKKKLGLLGR